MSTTASQNIYYDNYYGIYIYNAANFKIIETIIEAWRKQYSS